jgi:hypothetical protein
LKFPSRKLSLFKEWLRKNGKNSPPRHAEILWNRK